jgi:hypothetical protein
MGVCQTQVYGYVSVLRLPLRQKLLPRKDYATSTWRHTHIRHAGMAVDDIKKRCAQLLVCGILHHKHTYEQGESTLYFRFSEPSLQLSN